MREPNPAHQVLEARVRAQGIKYRIAFEKREPEIALLKAFFKPGERFILVAEANVDFREVGGRHISFLRQLLQIRNHLAGVCGVAHSAVNITDRRVGFCREVPCFLQFLDGLLEPALLGEGLAEVKMGGPEARLEIRESCAIGKSLIVAPRLIQGLRQKKADGADTGSRSTPRLTFTNRFLDLAFLTEEMRMVGVRDGANLDLDGAQFEIPFRPPPNPSCSPPRLFASEAWASASWSSSSRARFAAASDWGNTSAGATLLL